MPDEQTPWVVKGVPEYIRRKVKIFAVQRGITMAQAIEQIVDVVIPGEPWEFMTDPGKPLPLPERPISSGVDMETWLKAWLSGSPVPWVEPQRYSWHADNGPRHTHEWVQGHLRRPTTRDLPESVLMDIDAHLHMCEECRQFAKDLVDGDT